MSDTKGLSPALRPACDSIRKLLASTTRDEARTRHRIGTIIAGIKKSPRKYGARAVEELARATGTNQHTLYRCAAVAECWSEEELEALLQRTNPYEQPVSWSHLVFLAGVRAPGRRAELLEKAIHEGLTVRELLAIEDTDGVAEGPDGRLAVLNRVVRASERWSRAAVAMHDQLLAELEGAQSLSRGPAELIDRAIAAQEQLQTVIDRQLQRLRAERGRFEPRKAVAPVRSAGLLLAGVRPR